MFENTEASSGFSVDNLDEAKTFYGETLGIRIEDQGIGFVLHLAGGANVFVYPKPDHTPATFTILNFAVDDIDATVDQLAEKGITMKQYEGEMATDEKGILRGAEEDKGPNIAWFTDPAGNVLSVIEN
jgi:predicted enzyme related to lactoylglutathione lyase